MTAPDLATYRAVHLALRAGADTLAAVAATVQPANRARAGALARYWDGYAAAVHKHHTTEDTIFFPALAARVPVAAALVARTDAEHEELDAVVDRCHRAIAALGNGVRTDDLPVAFGDLARHMGHHLDFEDEDILPLFERHLSVEEYQGLEAQADERLSLRQAMFMVPFIFRALTPEMQDHLKAGAPLPLRVVERLARPGFERLVAALDVDLAPAPVVA